MPPLVIQSAAGASCNCPGVNAVDGVISGSAVDTEKMPDMANTVRITQLLFVLKDMTKISSVENLLGKHSISGNNSYINRRCLNNEVFIPTIAI